MPYKVRLYDKVEVEVDNPEDLLNLVNKLNQQNQQTQQNQQSQQSKKTKKHKKHRKANDEYHKFLSECMKVYHGSLKYCVKRWQNLKKTK
ncbi:hypothetical protein SBRV1_gp40 [Sulfolobales Beppu rod-shaped virus 1]|uniref:Uncharacterized protein n=1 Tax=Sulfolobales Beppu rod-shaped virus 1 TaxID=2493121 RepID=A0A3S8NF56_9VIRU|nr:hypothetical protein QIT32_gp40 [Sulfolobales Beppu rod-shaped virus 1]AZI75929.1 hypothetical protein SBRV1_gp40 [Sulfolobales Beppu rod-shaped virus 1]